MESKLTERAEKMLSDREQEIVRKALEKATGVDVESEVGDVRYHAGNSDFAFDGGGDTMLYVGYYEDDPKPYTVSIENMSGQQIAMEDAKDFKSVVKLAMKMAKKYKKRLTEASEKTYIDFLNKKKGFKQDRIYFNSYEDAVKWAKANLGKFNPDVIKFEHISDTSGATLVEATTPKQQTPEQIKAIVDKLKTNQKIQLWYDSSIKKGENWVPVVVGRRSFSKKYNVGKITLRYADAPRASKLFFYDRDGKISLALGNLAARLVAIKTSVKEGAFSKRVAKVADRKVKSAKSGNVRVKSKVWFKRGKATIGGVVYGIDGDTLTIKTKRGVVKKKKSEVAVIREGKSGPTDAIDFKGNGIPTEYLKFYKGKIRESINELDRMGHTGRLSRIVFYDKDEWTDRKYGTKTIGVFNAKSWGNVASTGKLYALESSDKKLVKGIKLKAGEHIFRYSTPKMLGTKEPLIKINVKKGLIYFLRDDLNGDEIAFETKSTPVVFLHLLKGKIRESVNEESYKVAGKRVTLVKGKKSDGTDWKVKFQNGKEVSLSDVLSLIKPFPKGIKEIKFSKAQLNRLGKEYEKIKGDKLPLGASKKLKVFLSMLDKEALEQMRDAKIKFISDEAGKILKKATNESSLNEGKKSKDDVGVRLVMAINNNVDSIYELVNREKKDPKEVMSAFATPLLNSVKGVLKHNYKPHPADSSNADKLKVFIGEVKKFEKIVELLIKRPSKSGVKKLDAAWRSIWNHKGGSAIGMNGQGPFADTIIESLNEADYKVYHKSFTGSADEARKFAEKRGFEIDEDDWQSQIGLGGRNIKSRPSVGKTHNFTIGLLKDGKPQRKALQISVYGMKNGYELNAYIN